MLSKLGLYCLDHHSEQHNIQVQSKRKFPNTEKVCNKRRRCATGISLMHTLHIITTCLHSHIALLSSQETDNNRQVNVVILYVALKCCHKKLSFTHRQEGTVQSEHDKLEQEDRWLAWHTLCLPPLVLNRHCKHSGKNYAFFLSQYDDHRKPILPKYCCGILCVSHCH